MSKAAPKHDEVIETLNHLIETCRDGQNGFLEAHNKLENPQIREFCLEQSRNRGRFVGELQQEVVHLGGDPENLGSFSAAIHRSWINLKSVLGAGDYSILAACEDGEEAAVNTYKSALQRHLPANLQSLIQKQHVSIQESYHRTKHLKDSLNEK